MFQIILFVLGGLAPSDSLRMEMINGKPFVVHQVDEKETLYSISRRYGATIPGILEQNPKADAGLEVGQILKVPYAPKPKGQLATATTNGLVHKVAAKETLFSIARLYNVSVDDIKNWNNMKENSLSVGQEIIIKNKPSVEAVETKVAQPAAAKSHTVAAKETLYSIARQYGITVQQLKEWNNMQESELKIGQVLSVAAPATVLQTTPSVTAVAPPAGGATATAVVKTATSVRISEGVNGSDEIKESGMAELIEGSEGNRKYLAQHLTAKPGTILKIRNLTTNQEVFVRVTGPPPSNDPVTIIHISRSAYDRLGATTAKFQAEITYYK